MKCSVPFKESLQPLSGITLAADLQRLGGTFRNASSALVAFGLIDMNCGRPLACYSMCGAGIKAEPAVAAFGSLKNETGFSRLAFWVAAPPALQCAAFKVEGCPDTRPVMGGIPVDLPDDSLHG